MVKSDIPAGYFSPLNISVLRWLYLSLFLLPLNIYIIGNWMGTGIQWAFFRYQVTYMGSSVIPVTRSFTYGIMGNVTGKTAFSEALHFFGILCFVVSFILVLSRKQTIIQKAGILIISGGILILLSLVSQYSMWFYGPAGTVIPVGLPLMFILGILLCRYQPDETITDSSGKTNTASGEKRDTDSILSTSQSETRYITLPLIREILQNKEIVFLFFLCCIFFYKIFLNYNQMIVPSGGILTTDIILQYSFWRSLFATSILQGFGIPFWNPYVFSGCPFLGNPQSGMFYPFTWLFMIFNSDLLFGYLFFIDVFLIGAFTYAYARTINLGKYGSLISAITFMFCGAVIPRIYAGHLSNLDAMIWFPLMLLFYERAFRGRSLLNGCGAGISLALMCLAGNLQIFLIGAVTGIFYVFFRICLFDNDISLQQKTRRALLILAAALTICCALSAVQLLPTWEFSHYSNRDTGLNYTFSTQYSLPPANLITMLIPDFYGYTDTRTSFWGFVFWEFSCYLGMVPLVLAMTGAILHKTRYRTIFFFLAGFALLFSFGKYSPVYPFFFDWVPFFSSFRVPPRMLFVFLFSLAMLAGFGGEIVADAWKNCNRKFVPLFRTCLLASAIGILGLCIAICSGWRNFGLQPEAIGTTILSATIYCISACAIAFQDYLRPDLKWFKKILVTVIILDLFLFGMQFIDTQPVDQVLHNPDYIPLLKNETDDFFRIYDETGSLSQNIAFRNNLSLAKGYDPTYLKDYQKFFMRSQPGDVSEAFLNDWGIQNDNRTSIDTLQLLNVRYIITTSPVNSPDMVRVYNDSVQQVYRINTTYPRAYLIPVSEFENRTPVIMKPARITHYSPNEIAIDAETPEVAYLVTSEIWYPGWTAKDNNKTVEVEKNQGIFRAVKLSPGKHEVVFTYFPKIFTFT